MKGTLLLVSALLAPQLAAAQAPRTRAPQTAVFAGGCFWGVEAVFEHTRGVMSAVSGYAGGSVRSPSYEQVSDGNTGHAESVRVTYDPAQVSYQQLLEIFFLVAHDPTQLNRQGPDIGTQYRSAVFYGDEGQRRAAREMVTRLAAMKVWPGKIVTAIEPLKVFYPAEAYHQHYLTQHPDQPYIVVNDLPKLERLKRRYPLLYRDPGVD
jgi:peptide-methionine (S)-S-oxide reductase